MWNVNASQNKLEQIEIWLKRYEKWKRAETIDENSGFRNNKKRLL